MDIPIFIVDAFAREPFEGNPAAICLVGPEQVLFLLIDYSKFSILTYIKKSRVNYSDVAFCLCVMSI